MGFGQWEAVLAPEFLRGQLDFGLFASAGCILYQEFELAVALRNDNLNQGSEEEFGNQRAPERSFWKWGVVVPIFF